MYDEAMRFVWDAENIEHVARHGVSPQEVEEVLAAEDSVIVPARGGRISAYGVSVAGRVVRVIYDSVGNEDLRVITAYPIRRRLLDRIRQEAQP